MNRWIVRYDWSRRGQLDSSEGTRAGSSRRARPVQGPSTSHGPAGPTRAARFAPALPRIAAGDDEGRGRRRS